MTVIAIFIGFFAFIYVQSELYAYLRKIDMTNRVMVESLRCLLSVELSERFKDDKDIIAAKHKYIRSTIKLLDYLTDQASDQVKETSKKGDK